MHVVIGYKFPLKPGTDPEKAGGKDTCVGDGIRFCIEFIEYIDCRRIGLSV